MGSAPGMSRGSAPQMLRSVLSNDWRIYSQNWRWITAFGIICIVLGIIALLDSMLTTIASMIVFGWVLLLAGILEGVHAFRDRKSGNVFLHSLNAALWFVLGLMLLRHPVAGAVVMTLLLAVYFTVAGVFRIVSALRLRLPHWGWALASGVITLLLGISLWAQWPVSGLWVIGLFIGIDLISMGLAQVMFAFGLLRLAAQPA